MTHIEKAEQYCRDVLDGVIVSGKWIKLACQRYLDDLDRQDDPDFPYQFSEKHASKVCKFAEMLPHVKGKWARSRELLKLQPWQCFILVNIFGWRRKADGFRRFRQASIFVSRKNGKSFLATVIGLYMLRFDNEPAAEVLCGATTLEQAEFVFRPAQQMVEKTPGLTAKGIVKLANALIVPADGSKMIPVIGQPPDGSNPSCALLDEAHEWTNDLLLSTMTSGMGSREQPLIVMTTTAGYNTASPAKLMQDELQDVLAGVTTNEELFGVIYAADEDVDWKTELALRQANPNMGISVMEGYLLKQQQDAINSPRKQTTFKTKNLCIWTSTAVSWITRERWRACIDDTLKIEDFLGQPCWVGLDLANKLDLTAYVKVFRNGDDYVAFPTFYLPEARIEDVANGFYKDWSEKGYLEATPGSVNTHRELREDILEDAKRFELMEIAHDPYQAIELVTSLIEEGITCVEVRQNVAGLSDSMKSVEAAVIAKTLRHADDPVMDWCVSNCKALLDRRHENPVPTKESPEKKIDGVPALIMAYGRAMIAPKQQSAGFFFAA